MKTFRFLTTWLMLLACISLSSCSNDDDNGKDNDSTEASIVGTWQYKEDDFIMILTINKEGTFLETSKEFYNGKWKTVNDSGTYKYSKNTLTLTYENDDEPFSVKVISVTSTSLTINDEGDILIYTRL